MTPDHMKSSQPRWLWPEPTWNTTAPPKVIEMSFQAWMVLKEEHTAFRNDNSIHPQQQLSATTTALLATAFQL